MIAKDLMPWMFVKRTAKWTPYVKIRSELLHAEAASIAMRAGRKTAKRTPRV